MPRYRHPRRSLAWAEWPATDRAAWEAAIATGDILDGQGPAAHWAAATRHTNLVHYGHWLGYLRQTGRLTEHELPEGRATIASIRGYIAQLEPRVAPRTVVSTLVGLKVMLKAMAPMAEWRWLADLCNALNRRALPRMQKRQRMRPTGEIYAAAIAELDRLSATPLRRRIERVAFRDTLMLAMLACRPLRLRNFAQLGIGRQLRREGSCWLIVLAGEEVKNRYPLEHALPDSLVPYLERYLERVRPTFGGHGPEVWLGFEGQPLTAHSIYGRILLVSQRLLGVAINPHLLRDCAATSLSTVSPAAALAAAALLGHRRFATTERHYIRANQLEAGRTINAVLAKLSIGVE